MIFNLLRIFALVAGPLVGYFFFGHTVDSALIGLGVSAFVVMAELIIDRIPLDAIVFGLVGGVGGMILAKIIDWLVFKFSAPNIYGFVSRYTGILYVFLIYLGAMVAFRKKDELDLLDRDIIAPGKKNKDIKILDTSVLIDGRIADVIQTGFLSGRLIVPRFVLHELQMVADSADATKRQRGRRGLDILKRIQDIPDADIRIYDKDYGSIKEVDTKVLELAKEMGGKVATTDFNLNKVAALQGISVLNVNDLSTALKSVVLPGDSMTIFLAREGKEKNQAVGYLDDGTMVVVDEARSSIGKRVGVHVNSILQTSAGRMIFGKYQETREQGPSGRSAPSIRETDTPTE